MSNRSLPRLRELTLAAIRTYQRTLSPLLSPACRFHPSCSEFARIAIERDGLVRGGRRAVGRLLRCTPLQRGGLDLP